MGFLDKIGGFLDSASDFAGSVGGAINSFDSFTNQGKQGSAPPFPSWFPPIFQPPAFGAPTAPPANIAAGLPSAPVALTAGVGTPVMLLGGAVVLLLVLKR